MCLSLVWIMLVQRLPKEKSLGGFVNIRHKLCLRKKLIEFAVLASTFHEFYLILLLENLSSGANKNLWRIMYYVWSWFFFTFRLPPTTDKKETRLKIFLLIIWTYFFTCLQIIHFIFAQLWKLKTLLRTNLT